MTVSWMSNTLLLLGVVMLAMFGLMQIMGIGIDPLLPAGSAFLIGCTAVIDRIGERKLSNSK